MSKKIQVKANPNSSQVSVDEMADGTVKVNLTVPPTNGEANKQLKEVLANEYGVKPKQIKIKRGKTSRRKTVIIN